MNNFSVLILTFNEEIDISDCIDSVSISNDIVVLDSFSIDKTEEIAKSKNVRFYKNKFIDYSDQRNFGLHQIKFVNEFVLLLDADERVSSDLLRDILKVCNFKNPLDVYLIRRKVVLDEKILSWNYSTTFWIERLVKPKNVKFEGSVHEKLIFQGKNGFIKGYILHLQFSKGINHWIKRRKNYAQIESFSNFDMQNIKNQNANVISKRYKMKEFFVNQVPFFYLIYFFYNFFVKFAFLDGFKGIKYISLETYSLHLISKYKKNASKFKIP